MKERWECLESKKIFKAGDGKTVFIELYQDRVRTPNGNVFTYTKYHASDVVIVVPFVDSQRVLMIRQFRYPVGKVLLEFPAGHVDNKEEPLDAAKRELEEETGYRARKLDYLYSYHPSVSRTKQSVHVFKATGLARTSATRHDSGEQISIETVTVKKLGQLISKRKVQNAGTLIAYLLCCTMKINPGKRR
ncbi:MAG TPA: NUDIX hydrolase [Nitrososphaera sp.]|jgi:ADP-ribose pyrophosphatase|nr:NUDIX hydrolase [Nitrososphaera sp.]